MGDDRWRIVFMRKPRQMLIGAWYHVTARANRGEMVLNRGDIRDLFVALLVRCKKRHDFGVINFCIMGNHVHLMIRPGEGECLSDIMRWLLGVFAQAYNRKVGITGHFWGDRFHSRILDGLGQIALAFGYIDENPSKAGLVRKGDVWKHSGLWNNHCGLREMMEPRQNWIELLFPRWRLPVLAEKT